MYKRNLKTVSKRRITVQKKSVVIIPKIFKGLRKIYIEYRKPIQINFIVMRKDGLEPGYAFNVFKNIMDKSKRPYELIGDSTYMNDCRLNEIACPKYNMKRLVRYYI